MIPFTPSELAGLITIRTGLIGVPPSVLSTMQIIVNLVNANAPNTTSLTAIYSAVDTQVVLDAQIDVVGVIGRLVSAKIIMYCELLGVYYVPINGSKPLASVFVLI